MGSLAFGLLVVFGSNWRLEVERRVKLGYWFPRLSLDDWSASSCCFPLLKVTSSYTAKVYILVFDPWPFRPKWVMALCCYCLKWTSPSLESFLHSTHTFVNSLFVKFSTDHSVTLTDKPGWFLYYIPSLEQSQHHCGIKTSLLFVLQAPSTVLGTDRHPVKISWMNKLMNLGESRRVI